MINIKINNQEYLVEEGLTILEACRKVNIDIPTLCYYKNLVESGNCRVCLVEVKGNRNFVTACNYKIYEGMEIFTNTIDVIEARKKSLELIISNHSMECLNCSANNNCELQSLTKKLNVQERYYGKKTETFKDELSGIICRDTSKCILCGRCIEMCKKTQGIGILNFENRGLNTILAPAANKSFKDVPCTYCGQCTKVCPTGALTIKENIRDLLLAIKEGKHIVAQTAPAVRAGLGEEFGYPIGTNVEGKMVAALRKIGCHKVYDVNFGADLTIIEESNEFIERFSKKENLPLITSCCPGWVRYAETYYPELLNHLSSCKSPHMMEGALIKSYYAEKNNIDPKDIVVVSIMPCSAKKEEKDRNNNDVDIVLTTVELANIIKLFGISFKDLEDEKFDTDLLGDFSGAGVIFGASGGVMEAALRTAYHTLTNNEYDKIKFETVRGINGIKEASLEINGNIINVAVAHSLSNAKVLLEQIKQGTCKYDFIEVMACPLGCINGAGQPKITSNDLDINEKDNVLFNTYKRANALYKEDENLPIRQSHNNPQIKQLYSEYLEKPGSHIAHELLHTTYCKKDKSLK